MRIYQSIKSILNAFLNYIANNILPNVSVTRLTFSDLTYMETAPKEPELNSLYDLKTTAVFSNMKNWLNINNTSKKDITRQQAPTLFNDIFNKYQNADFTQSQYTQVLTFPRPLYKIGTYYYGLLCERNVSIKVVKSLNPDMSNYEVVEDTGVSINTTNFYSSLYIDINPDNYVYVFVASSHLFKFSKSDFSFISDINNSLGALTRAILYNGVFYYISDRYTISALDLNTNTVIKTYSIPATYNQFRYSNIFIKNNKMYFVTTNTVTTNIQSICFMSVDILTGTQEFLYRSNSGVSGYQAAYVFEKDNNICVLAIVGNQISLIQPVDGVYTLSQISGLTNNYPLYITNINGTFYIVQYVSSSAKIVTTTDWITFNTIISNYASYETYTNIHINIYDTNFIFLDNNSFITSIYTKTVYTDNYTINGSSIAINYYKNGNFKICVPDPANDANLETLFNAYGYLNYWRIDVSNLLVNTIRNKNPFTYMYVGDNFLENVNITELYQRSALFSELNQILNSQPQIRYYQITETISDFTASDFSSILEVYINGVLQTPTTDYTVSGNVISFTNSLTSSDSLAVRGYLVS